MGADKLFVRQIQVLFSVVKSVIVAGLSVHEHKQLSQMNNNRLLMWRICRAYYSQSDM